MPGETDPSARYGLRQLDRNQSFVLVVGCEGAAGRHGDPKPRDDHLSDGFEGVPLPTFCV